MHIGKKIIDDISEILTEEYNITLTDEEYKTFTNPFYEDHTMFHRKDYKSRQCISVGLMNKIMMHDSKRILHFLSELAGMEPQIQELQPWNRDHVVHAIHTFFTGVYLIKNISPNERSALSSNKNLMWRLIAPTHDMGYPLEIAGNIQKGFIDIMNNILSKFETDSIPVTKKLWPDNLNKLCNGKQSKELIQNKLIEWELGIDMDGYYNWLQELNRVDHGVIGALAQLKIMDAKYHEKNGRTIEDSGDSKLDMASAAASVFVHNIDLNYPGFSKKINFYTAPEAFLLFLCDTFQEWDRYADRRSIFHGHEFNIKCRDNRILLYVPKQLETHISDVLNTRLDGLPILVNDRLAVN